MSLEGHTPALACRCKCRDHRFPGKCLICRLLLVSTPACFAAQSTCGASVRRESTAYSTNGYLLKQTVRWLGFILLIGDDSLTLQHRPLDYDTDDHQGKKYDPGSSTWKNENLGDQ